MKLKRLKALVMTGALVMSMGMTAFAEERGTTASAPDVGTKITKNLEFAEGITVPSAVFKFEITKVTSDAPAASIADISYSDADEVGTLANGKYTISKDAAISFGTFPHAGVYEYTVKETADTYSAGTGEAVAYDSKEYTLYVYVVNTADGGTEIESVAANTGEGTKKEAAVAFTNTYTKRGGSGSEEASLTIRKNTTGDYADKTKDFTFRITFTKAATEAESVTSYTGKIGAEEVVCGVGQETTFQLHDGESLVFENLPAGTRYSVEEVGAEDGYTASVTVVENGVTTVTNKAAASEKEGVTSTAANAVSNLVGEKSNSATFTNNYDDVPITGIIFNNLPFVILIAAAAAAFAVLAALRRRSCR